MKIFKKFDLKLDITANLHKINFLDVTLDLVTGKYSPYNKPNHTPAYIHVESNHPENIIKNIPSSAFNDVKMEWVAGVG